jgi:hypothetical protein
MHGGIRIMKGRNVPLEGRSRSGHFRRLTMRNHEDNRTLPYVMHRLNDNIFMYLWQLTDHRLD